MNRVLIVDDHPLVSEAISAAILTIGHFTVASATSAAEMWLKLESAARGNEKYSIVFLDIYLPDAHGTDLVRQLTERYQVSTILISGQDDEFCRNACLNSGASGFVKKSAKLPEFVSALQAVLVGGQYFPFPRTGSARVIPGANIAELSDRHRQVLDLVIKGKSNKQIGDELFLAEGTVRNKVSELLRIFDVQSRTQILFTAAQMGYRPLRQ